MSIRVTALLKEMRKLPAYWKAVSLAKASCLFSDTKKKFQLIEEAKELMKKLDDIYFHSLALSEIASIIHPIKRDRSIQLFRRAFEQSLGLRNGEKDASLEWMIYYLAQIGEIKLAREYIRSVENSFYKDISYLCISWSLAKRGMTPSSLNILKNIKSCYFGILAKACIANEIHSSDKHLSEALFTCALEEVDQLDHFNATCVLSHLLYLREEVMEEKLTRRIFDKAMNMFKKIKLRELRDIVSARLVPSLVKYSKYTDADIILSDIRDPFYASLARVRMSFILMTRQKDLAFKLLSTINMRRIQDPYKDIIRAKKAHVFALGGRLTEAIKLAGEIEDEGYRGVAMKSIMDTLVEKEHTTVTELLEV